MNIASCLFWKIRLDSKSKYSEMAPEASLFNTGFNYRRGARLAIKMSSQTSRSLYPTTPELKIPSEKIQSAINRKELFWAFHPPSRLVASLFWLLGENRSLATETVSAFFRSLKTLRIGNKANGDVNRQRTKGARESSWTRGGIDEDSPRARTHVKGEVTERAW